MPGSFWSCSTKRARGSGRDTINSQFPMPYSQSRIWRLGVGGWDLTATGVSQTGDLQTAHQAAHRLTELLVHLAAGVVDGGHDQILQHLHVVLGDDLGIDLDRLQLLGAVHGDGDHAAAGRGLDAQLGHLLLQALLHLLRLLHHGLDVHISSTSRISAGMISSMVCTAEDDMASALRSRFPAAGASTFGCSTFAAATPTSPPTAVTLMRLPAAFSAADSSHARASVHCSRSARCVGENVKVMASSVTSIRCACATTML